MMFIADENLPIPIVDRLREAGHHVDLASTSLNGVSDSTILRLATEAESIVVTEDKDFGELVFRDGMAHSGVLFLRLDGLSTAEKSREVMEALAAIGDDLIGTFTVLTPDGWRIRSP